MSEILLYYKRPDPTTWVYLSSFLTIGLFFVFHRFWSVRNLDIILLILLAPGLLMVYEGRRRQLVQSEVTAQQLEMRRPDRPSPPLGRTGRLSGFGDALHAFPVFALLAPVQNEPTPTDAPASASSGNNADESADRAKEEPATDNPSATSTGSASSTGSGANAAVDSSAANSPSDADAPSAADDASGSADDAAVGDATVAGDGGDSELTLGPHDPRELQSWGFIYLFVVEAFLLLRLMLDPLMVRRPLLDPNLTTGGLNFIGISLFIFMMANVVTSNPRVQVEQGPELGPGYAMMNMLPAIPTRPVSDQPGGAFPPPISELTPQQIRLTNIAKALAILAQLAIVSGIVLVGSRHFSNLRAGVGCALLYLLLPYTAQMTGRVDHALPAALLLWAVLSYRRPLLSGIFLGLAGGLVYYPLFLLPLWFSFYWQRGARKFAVGVLAMLAMLMVALYFDDSASLGDHLQRMFGLLNPNRDPHEFRGIWALGWNPIWRLPVIVAFVILATFFAIWPAQKNLGTLMSASAALMVAAQFWHGYGGGLYIAWFLPLLLLVIFRPNLQDRIATKVVAGPYPLSSSDRTELEPA